MRSSANVRSIAVLQALRTALQRFSGEAQTSLATVVQDIQRTVAWLEERARYWEQEVRKREALLAQAERALAICRSRAYRDPKTGAYYEPACPAEEAAVFRAQRYLQEAERELHTVQRWINRVQEAIGSYQREVQRLMALLDDDMPQAAAFLSQKSAQLGSYIASSAGVGQSAPPGGSPSTTGLSPPELIQQLLAGLPSQERLSWLARAVSNEARSAGHRILAEADDEGSGQVYSCISWYASSLHLWQIRDDAMPDAVDLGQELAALSDAIHPDLEQFLRASVAGDPDETIIMEAMSYNRVQWHVRRSPDTGFKQPASSDWGAIDGRQYSYEEIVNLFDVPVPDTPFIPPSDRDEDDSSSFDMLG